jgi:Polyketide cyclase / dehydrase and lipid transport
MVREIRRSAASSPTLKPLGVTLKPSTTIKKRLTTRPGGHRNSTTVMTSMGCSLRAVRCFHALSAFTTARSETVEMEIIRKLVAPVDAPTLFSYVDDLGAYERWMPLIHDVEPIEVGSGEIPAWTVELRAQVGPFARSKRLRMERTIHHVDQLAVFERNENDGRSHSSWVLRAELTSIEGDATHTALTMSMSYDGSLWSGAVLQRVLDDQVRQGSEALLALVG